MNNFCKKYNRIILFLAFLILFPLLSDIKAQSAPQNKVETVPQIIRETAVKGLPGFLKSIPPEDLKRYNFSTPGELDAVVLGNPLKIYTIVPEKIANYTPKTPVEKIISPTSVWLFPVISKGKTVTLLVVDSVKGQWKAVAIGNSGLAKQLNNIMKQQPLSEGYEYIFVRVFQAKADFVLLCRNEKTTIIPLESARISLKLTKEKTYTPSEIIFKLQKIVRDNISAVPPINKGKK
ncbi:MAG: hypothetical protein PHX21_01625 [bacterium]|nr:hypothetical protein [bacterium]